MQTLAATTGTCATCGLTVPAGDLSPIPGGVALICGACRAAAGLEEE